MAWLSATLAFATTMLFFALFVSTIVEALHRILRLRHQGMRLMLEALYDKVIAPHVRAKFPASELSGEKFARWIMENRPLSGGTLGTNGRIGSLMLWLTRDGESTNIPTEIFTQRLVDSRMAEVANALTDEIVQNIAQHYEAYGKEITEFFRARAQVLSLIVAFFVAFAFHVHPHALVSAYMSDPGLAEKVIAQGESQQSRINEIVGQVEETVEEAGPGAETTTELRAALDALRQEMEKGAATVAELAEAGVPVGWSEVPVCEENSGWTEPCYWPLEGGALPSFGTGLWLVIGGVLIGLGAPFWAQAVGALSATSGAAKRISELVSPETAAPARTAVPLTRMAAPTTADVPGETGSVSPPPPAIAAFNLAKAQRPKAAEGAAASTAPATDDGNAPPPPSS